MVSPNLALLALLALAALCAPPLFGQGWCVVGGPV